MSSTQVKAQEKNTDGVVADVRRLVASCRLAHAVSIRGTDTRDISNKRLDFQSCGLEIRIEQPFGLEISYVGTNLQRQRLTVPWANVVEFRF